MSSFLRGQVDPSKGEDRYNALGYAKAPFPTQGEVFDVYVPRDELAALRQDLVAFLSGREHGKVWALSGEQGVGKSNFLRMVGRQLDEMTAEGEVAATGSHLFQGNAWAPAHLVAGVAAAIGTSPVEQLVETTVEPPAGFARTDFGRFWNAARGTSTRKDASAEFLMRWLSGLPTFAEERRRFGVQARERLAPAIAVPYLRALVEMLAEAGILKRLILLFDELENVQAMKAGSQTEYLQLLKTLLNAFNWQGLYVMLAGAPSVFRYLQAAFPSLAGRWHLVVLEPIQSVEQAVRLADEHKTCASLPDKKPAEIAAQFPSEVDVKAAYVDLARSGRGLVRQRDLLTHLHELVEQRLQGGSPEAKRRLP